MTPQIPTRLPTLERWTLIEEVFHEARAAEGDERVRTLARLCATDDQLLAEVRALLDADEESNRSPQPCKVWKADLAGQRAGNYQLDSLLGMGGMGSVYLAHRCDGQFDRKVAFKFLSAHLRNEFFTARFAGERNLLAGLDHPNITRLIDSGVTESGDPYLVLEYVDGEPIDEYCDRLRLTVRERVAMLLDVCEAVGYAHSVNVIHRDLKPSNILVSREGRAKLLDFGTAKLLESDTNVTTTGFHMLTPRYASPEQLRRENVGPSTDVYSLGIILYELVTGVWPFGDPRSTIAGFERAVRDVAPRPPGSVIHEDAAERRGTTKEALIRETSGPLWNVIRKSIEPEPERRYASVADFVRDLRGYLHGGKVQAEPESARRRVIAVVAIALACSLGIFLAIAKWRTVAPQAPSIAVLPFAGNSYLASGLTAEVTESLNRHANLKVIAQSSARQVAADFKSDFRKAGERLNVTNLLTGSVEQADDRVKVIATLIRPSDGATLWTNTYQRTIGDLSAIESDLDRSVSASLGIAPAPAKHMPNEEAHALYLRARYLANDGAAGIAQAEQLCRRAAELDPEYPDAWTCLSQQLWNKNTVNPEAADIEAGLDYALKALALDPDDVRAHYEVGLDAMYFDWDWKRAEREFSAAAARRFSGGEMSLALLYLITGRGNEVEQHLRRARDLDPASGAVIINTAEIFALEGRYAEAGEQYQFVANRLPRVSRWQILTAMCAGRQGKKDEAVRRLRAISEPGPEVQRELAYWSGDWTEARRILDSEAHDNEVKMGNGAQSGLSMTSLAEAYGALGDEQGAVKWLERAIDSHDGDVIYIHVAWQFAKFQNAPEFHRLKKRVNLDW